MKKYLSLFVALLMVLTIAPAAVAEEEPVTLTMFYPSTRPMNEFTDLTREYVKEAIGIDMNVIQGGDNWKQQLALFITGGDIPDLMAFMDAATFQGYAADGAFYDISDLVRDYPNIMAYLDSVVGYSAEDMLARTTVDGAIYGIPSVTTARSYYSLNIRTDWLENVGLEIPTTLDEFTEVMRAFTNDDPDGDGQNDTYGFSGNQTYNSLTPFFGAFGARPDQCYFLNDEGKVVTNVISEDYKAALEYIKSIYDEGLIDPEMFTATYEQSQEKVVRGEFGLWTGWWSVAGNVVSRFGYTDTNPEDSLTVIDPPVGADGKSGIIAQDPCESYMAIAYNTENVDAVLRLIDYACSTDGHRTLMWGVEGQFWTQDENGDVDWYFGIDGVDKEGNEVSDMQVYRFFYNIPIENSVRTLSDTFSSRLYQKSIEIYTDVEVYPNLFLGLTSNDFVTYNSDLETYVKEAGIKFITGESSLETDWDSYVETYLSMGGEAVRTSLLEAYNALNGTSLEFA
ncbi:MAG: extracellular solute-binding protein [Candidatus Faecivicinus sp.]